MRLIVIDYGMGNLRSVTNAFEAAGCKAIISTNPTALKTADGIVLPGVGAFGDGMKNLQTAGWIDTLEKEVRQHEKPFLGICLGMQLLAVTGTEHGINNGLGWIPGIIKRIPIQDNKIKVPHIGWNDVRFVHKDGLYAGLGDSQSFYFVHSYMFVPENSSIVSGICSHGIDFTASIEFDNIFATQFHPEKSHKAGLTVLKNFLNQLGRV